MKSFFKFTTYQIIVLSFAFVILSGAVILTLPISNKEGVFTPFLDALFTSTSATCVTGLIIYDTFTHWSYFGQAIILLLIQIGGLGFMTLATFILIALGRSLGIYNSKIIMQTFGSFKATGGPLLIKKILAFTFSVETIGFFFLLPVFVPKAGGYGVFISLFTSISAFCNAGFDICGVFGEEFASLTSFATDPLLNVTIMALIISGGLGFIVWNDIATHGLKFSKYQLHSKIVIITSALLIIIPALLILCFEYGGALKDYSLGEKLLISLFQSVTARTAGFNTVNYSNFNDSTNLLTTVLMFIGGSSGSTAGGIKTTTFVVMIFSIVAAALNSDELKIFKRRLFKKLTHQASAIFTSYIILIVISTVFICAVDNLPALKVLFETTSAIATVGLTLGITASLSTLSKAVVIALMYIGRVGFISFLLAFNIKQKMPNAKRPVENILIG